MLYKSWEVTKYTSATTSNKKDVMVSFIVTLIKVVCDGCDKIFVSL